MRIAAITRFKQGDIYAAIQRAGWTQSELARKTGLSVNVIGEIINMRKRPTEEQASAIQMALGEAGEYVDILSVWPEGFRIEGAHKVVQLKDVESDALLEYARRLELHSGSDEYKEADLPALMDGLGDREKFVLEKRADGETLESIANSLGVTRERVRQIATKTLREIRERMAEA